MRANLARNLGIGVVVGLALAVWLAPLTLSLVDVMCWFSTGAQCSAVPWGADRGGRALFVAIWTVAWPAVLLASGA
jgi:hypothetical protein